MTTQLALPTLSTGFFRRAASTYVGHAIRRGLDGVWVRGLDETRRLTTRRPVIFAATHVSWWDSLVVVALEDALATRGRALMDRQNLDRHPFFGWLGALPLDRSCSATARADLSTAARTLSGPRHTLWIFPQGRQRSPHLRPLGLRSGVHTLLEQSEAIVVPVALAYPWAEAPRPTAMVELGMPLERDALGPFLQALEHRLIAGLQSIDAASEGSPAELGFSLLVGGRSSQPETGIGSQALQVADRLVGARRV